MARLFGNSAYRNCIQNAIKCNGNEFFLHIFSSFLFEPNTDRIPKYSIIVHLFHYFVHGLLQKNHWLWDRCTYFWIVNSKAGMLLMLTIRQKGIEFEKSSIFYCALYTRISPDTVWHGNETLTLYCRLPFLYFHNVTAWSPANSIVLTAWIAFQSICSIVHLLLFIWL